MIKRTSIIIFIFSISIFAQININDMKLLPLPVNVLTTESHFRINDDFIVKYLSDNSRIKKAADRFIMRLAKRTGIFFKYPTSILKNDSAKSSLIIEAKRVGKLKINEIESYQLTVKDNVISLTSETDIGVLRGLETLLQLLEADKAGYYFPGVEINDFPRFTWRGLLIDVCRHFMPVNVIKRNLDGMAAAKMNVFHWHLTEDQGFRVECKTFPKLHELGSNGDYYTHEQIKDIINYAAERGIRVIPEFDIPGHATSWLVAYPELASAPGPYEIEKYYGIKDPTFNPTIEETYEFFDKFFAEMSQLFPDEYIHIGGDENNGKQWNANKSIQKFMKANNIKDNHELQAYFNKRILKILTKYNKKMIGWDEILHKDIPKNIVIQSWRGKEALVKAAKNGYQGILSNGYYIDLMQPTKYHYLNDPISKNVNLTKEEKKRILGGEATMWGEWVTEENIDSRIWPRTAAIAERLWSPSNVNDVENMFTRLNKFSLNLENLGLKHISYQPMMLRRLVNGENIKPLKTFIDVVEPLEQYKRGAEARKVGLVVSQFTPYTRVVDAANVDTKTVREFNKLVDNYLVEKKSKTLKRIKKYLNMWVQNQKDLIPIIQTSPILFEIKPMTENLTELAVVSLEGLRDNKTENNNEHFKNKLKKITEESRKSYGQVELVIVDAIERLFGIFEKN